MIDREQLLQLFVEFCIDARRVQSRAGGASAALLVQCSAVGGNLGVRFLPARKPVRNRQRYEIRVRRGKQRGTKVCTEEEQRGREDWAPNKPLGEELC